MRRDYKCTISISFLVAGLLLGGCSDGGTTTTMQGDRSAPIVVSSQPANKSTNVMTNTVVTLTFDEAIDVKSVTSDMVVLKEGSKVVAGSVEVSLNSLTFTPKSPLRYNTEYVLTLLQGLKDSSGNTVSVDQSWRFTTGEVADTVAPSVQSVSPQDGSSDIGLSTMVSVTFDEVVDPTTLNNVTFRVKEGDTYLSGTVSTAGSGVVFSPASPLKEGTLYTAEVTNGVMDRAGNALADSYSWSFTTLNSRDITPPTVVSTDPQEGDEVPHSSSRLSVIFSEEMNRSSITGETFTLKNVKGKVAGTVSYNNGKATLDVDTGRLALRSSYTARVTNWVRDLHGIRMAVDRVWNFLTTDGRWSTASVIENTDRAKFPQIAVDDSGNAIVVWQLYKSPYHIYSKHYDVGSDSWLEPELVENNWTMAERPKVAMDGSGNAVVVWVQKNIDDIKRIYSNYYDASSGSWSGVKLLPQPLSSAEFSQVAMDGNGNAVTVWQQYDGSYYSIYSSHYYASSGVWSAISVLERNAGHAQFPQVAMNDSGKAVAVWQQRDGSYYSIYSNHYDVNSSRWSTAVVIENNDTGSAMNPHVAVDGSGNAIAVWKQHDGTRNNIWSNRYDAGSGTWSTASLIEDSMNDTEGPQVAMDASGNAVVVWQQDDGTRHNIWSNRYDASSGSWSTASLIENSTNDAEGPQVAIDASGNAVVVWQQDDGTRNNIWSNRYDASSGSWLGATLIETNMTSANNPQIAVDGMGNGVSVWSQGAYIYSNRFE